MAAQARPAGPGERTRRQVAKVREAYFEDYDRIAAVQRRNDLAIRSREEWGTLWKGNPAYEARRTGWPVGWVLESDTAEVVGSVGNVPLAYELDGKPLIAATGRGWVVDPAYRGYSLAMLSRLINQTGIDFVIATTVGPRSERGYEAFGFARTPVGRWDRAAVWVTDYPAAVRGALLAKRYPFAAIASHPASVLLRARDWLKAPRLQAGGTGCAIETCPAFDARFDEFWDELRWETRPVLLAVRNSATLAWHFRHALAGDRLWIVTARDKSRVVAYAIFERRDHPAYGIRRMWLADAQALRGGVDALYEILAHALHRCRTEGVHALEIPGCRMGPVPVDGLAPHTRNLPCWTFYYKASRRDLASVLRRPEAWVPSCFDGDSSV